MSKVAIQGNASGTGTFTIAAPNSNTDRALTLPDEEGTVLTTTSGVAKTGDTITGQLIVEASNGAVTVKGASTGAQLRLERTTTNTGHGYLGADDTYALRVYNSAFADGLRVDQSGRVTMPYQPAFMAISSASGNTGGSGNLVFGDVRVNVGSCYNASTGYFTAPVAGYYQFSAHTLSRSGGVSYTHFRVNGSNYVLCEDSTSASAFRDTSGTMIVQLAANDTVNIYSPSATYGNIYDWFCGHLIS